MRRRDGGVVGHVSLCRGMRPPSVATSARRTVSVLPIWRAERRGRRAHVQTAPPPLCRPASRRARFVCPAAGLQGDLRFAASVVRVDVVCDEAQTESAPTAHRAGGLAIFGQALRYHELDAAHEYVAAGRRRCGRAGRRPSCRAGTPCPRCPPQ